MLNHTTCSRNQLAREGGSLSPQPGRNPRGAKKIEINPDESNMPSDW